MSLLLFLLNELKKLLNCFCSCFCGAKWHRSGTVEFEFEINERKKNND